MTNDKELEIQMQFLEEATDYLNTLESILLEIDTSKHIDLDKINAAMRAAHSIKGGAAMMGFRLLSNLAHRLEDSFKVLKTRKKSLEIDTHLQSLLLSGVDWLRQIVELLSEKKAPEDKWLRTFCYPIFDELHERLGDPSPEDITTMLSPEDGQEIIPLLFETEVEECLQNLESLLANSSTTNLQSEVGVMAAELGGLGEMLQLPAFTQLCESVTNYLETQPQRFVEIAQLALQAWRRSQALVLTNQRHSLPTEIKLNEVVVSDIQEQIIAPVQVTIHENYLITEALIPDLTSLKVELPPEINAVEFPEPNIAFTQEIASIDYKHLERKSEIIGISKDKEIHENTVRVPSKQLEEINDLFGEIIIQRNGLNSQLERLRKLVLGLSQRVQILDQEHQEVRSAYEKIIAQSVSSGVLTSGEEVQDSGVKGLEIDRYQKLNLLSQDVMETIVQVAEVTSDIQLSVDDTDQIARKLNKTSKQAQRKLTQVRMRPLSDLVERFPRAIRDLNIEYGKNVQLKIEGGKTLIERTILEALNEPLMHLLRNAFDHGIEDPATRHAQGKPEQGLIEIKGYHRSDRTIITMSDDGRGISLEKIRQRALAMGLDTALIATASEEELLTLIFEPGFTTSDQVTALSGRGVGMDIVQNNLKLVRGDITVDTQPGIGTTFTLSVPFTLSVARVLLVESDTGSGINHRMVLAFPTDVVAEIFLLENDQVFSMDGREFLKWQDTMLPLMRLGNYFEFNCSHYNNLEIESPTGINASSVLIIKNDHQPVAVQIDRCWGEQEVAIRQVEGNIPLPDGFSNCTILGDGRVVPLVNTSELVSWITSNQRPHRSNKLPTTKLKTAFLKPQKNQPLVRPSHQKGMILIVDDSINVRRYLALTLEKGGYQVEQAKDGQDAWEKLESGLKVQAVICDIEMPRLDGYSFLERVKSHDDLKSLPVAMLTSRSSNKHRQLAMQLGARAYFSKPYNEQDLLRTLEEIIFRIAETGSANN
ncbi:hybrid sensor histidine kinase/response regulator [Anabaena cylindrica FACHB-243]|uniref:histidine kinase n=1 Tax=Anabaena cylindrica (strain ATCC 27899 / PCC 7122) TaxID=272123 RepID=K9ZD35_ANACC|nr:MULTISPECIES: hybrid sensor histidine kinase/response regulator [Anabaena]AFZ56629.1 CheA signal transduction histidine kinase [Anabaena cylindrica PCC 7122]MBD2416199.1 hybrid sensor histidine kinase/response regulator [Anabaena cylindrica FACHB-243]MBY5284791.1 hybrid sensor histidine kinase/response regulator [Anabaena sp. CCAP 1446/1C]MBY5310979.1 hybrid sensor histidine kinase/response regulator [Anabaena sp. CCAP 1446/1C]MCM2408922.1 hybrid sensor histidine kinase/response regulator [